MTDPAARRPTGTVTLLFTDIEGSTRLWEAEPDAMAAALRRHDDILRGAIGQACGYVFKTVGDAFCAAFPVPRDAITAVLAAQRGLLAESWPTSRPVRVRMALHTGSCEERDDDYFGPVVNRTARLEAIAHGGQVLLSGATAELLAGTEVQAGLRDLGPHRLKDLGRPEQVFQLTASFLPDDFPPLASLDNPELPNNLPGQLSAFVGRDSELAEVREAVRDSRLVTLTGAGGAGKTRLALQVAAELTAIAPDGVWLAELAPVTEPDGVTGLLASILGLAERDGPGAADAVTEAMASQNALIVLDNCEHLIDAAAKLCDQLIRRCPKVRLLVTSREPLGIGGERVYRVPSLSLPPAEAEPAELAGSDAVLLFAERARLTDPAFAVTDESAPLVATICRRLDGIPLALELAAARLSAMSPQQVSDRLDQRFRLLTGGSRNAMPRQQTLQATVDWSYSLLNPAERDTLTRLSVFAGSFDLDAAEHICTSDTVDEYDVADLLGSLVAKSLITADHTAGTIRYRMLETIRQYAAAELLRTAGDDAVLDIRDKHAAWFRDLAIVAQPALLGPDQLTWLGRLDAEWDNLQAALAHLQSAGDTGSMLRLAAALTGFAVVRGHAVLLRYLRPAADQAGPEPSALTVEVLLCVNEMISVLQRTSLAELAAARRFAERALATARQLGDPVLICRSLGTMSEAHYIAGELAAGRAAATEAAEIARQLGDTLRLAGALQLLANSTADPAEDRRLRLEVLELCRQAGGEILITATQLSRLGMAAAVAGDYDEAGRYHEQALAIAERAGAGIFLEFMQINLASARVLQGRHDEAEHLARQALLAMRRTGYTIGLGEVLTELAACAGSAGHWELAATLQGAASPAVASDVELGAVHIGPEEQLLLDRERDRVREHLGAPAYDTAFAAGAALPAQAAIDLALGRTS